MGRLFRVPQIRHRIALAGCNLATGLKRRLE
jgi:hypothetical protein